MTDDFEHHLGSVLRKVSTSNRNGRPARSVTLIRDYDTTADDLWDAISNPERLRRWYAQVAGDLWCGGRFEIEGNASGTIMKCEPPEHLELTWEYGESISWVDVHVQGTDDGCARLTLEHTSTMDDHMIEFGPGAGGVGWEWSFMELARHFADRAGQRFDEDAFMATVAGRAFVASSSVAWGHAAVVDGDDPDAAFAAAERTRAFFVGDS